MHRQISLDIFRGLTLAAMLLVNNPGSWSHVYAPLLHAKWHGLTPTDLIFPFFMFIVGAAMFYSMAKFAHSGAPGHKVQVPWVKIVKRTTLLFLIGFLLNIYPFNGPISDWRIMGVLQRIALCYGVVAVLVCLLDRKKLWWLSLAILIAYWGLLNLVNLPYSLSDNLVRLVDIKIFGASHLYQGFGVAFDPEGLLSCLPALVTVIAGYLTSAMLCHTKAAKSQCTTLLVWATMGLVIGGVWHVLLPVNKALWTSSYVLVSAAFAWLVLSLIIYLYDIKAFKNGFNWAQIYGSNPLFVYVLAWLFAATLGMINWTNDAGNTFNPQSFIYQNLSQFMPEKLASLIFALLFVGLFYVVSHYLYKRKIFIKL